mmetsp:Transcript_11285/g.21349  ORF Transcript_11285/g.21349 Transcript_11285/m.21349 type:complete len:667 (-) Transcript_11285:196-2196(-)
MSRLLQVTVVLTFLFGQASGLPSGHYRSSQDIRTAAPVANTAAVQASSQPTEKPTQAIIAMPELQIQRFGHKCEAHCEGDDDGKQVGVVAAAEDAAAPGIVGVEASLEHASPKVSETSAVATLEASSPLQPAAEGVFLQLESSESKKGNSTVESQPAPSIGEVRHPDMPPVQSFGEVRPQVSTEMVVIRREEANLGKDTMAWQQQEGNGSLPSAAAAAHGNSTVSSAAVASPMPSLNDTGSSSNATETRASPPASASASNVLEVSDATNTKVPVIAPLPDSSAAAVVADALSKKATGVSGPKLGVAHAEQRRTWGTLFLLAGLLGAALLGATCLAMALWASTTWWSWRGRSTIRTSAESMTTWSAAKVEKKLPRSGGYDCTFSKPVSSGQLLRLEARVEGPSTGVPALVSPLTGQACVLYSAAVSQQVHDGIPPIPVAFSAASVDFMVSLVGAPHVRVELLGEEVSLFDMCGGRVVEKRSLANAPERWQDFVLTHRTAAPGYEWQANPMVRADSSALEFQECALLVGSVITLIGELHRGADGALTLRPLQGSDRTGKSRRGSAKHECWRTSWELGGCEATDAPPQREGRYGGAAAAAAPLATPAEAPSDKVLASDDPQLIGTGDNSVVREGCGLAGKQGGGLPAFAEMLFSSVPRLLRGKAQATRK